jgi:hypothetical protein
MATYGVVVQILASGLEDTNGNPLSGGKVYTYAAGTTTPKATYNDRIKSSTATNPIILSAYGTSLVFADGLYKFVIKDSLDNTIYTWDYLNYVDLTDPITVQYAVDSGSGGTHYVIAPTPSLTAYAAGQTFVILANQTNGGACDLNVNGLGVKSIKVPNGVDPTASMIPSGTTFMVTYNGTYFILMSGGYGLASPTITGNITGTYNIMGDPNIVWEISTTTLAVSYTIDSRDVVIIANPVLATGNINLLAAATYGAGKILYILNKHDTNVVSVSPSGAEKISGRSGESVYPYQSLVLLCDGSNYHRLDSPNRIPDLSIDTLRLEEHIHGDTTTGSVNVYPIGHTSLDDDDYFDISPGTYGGFGFLQAGDNTEYALFSFTSAAVVTIISNSANAVNTDTDVKFCIFDGGTSVRVRNRLGSAKYIKGMIWSY